MPIYFYYGDDSFQLLRECHKLKKQYVKTELDELEYCKVTEPTEQAFKSCVEQLMQVSMFGNKFIWFSGGDVFSKKNNLKDTVSALQNCPSNASILISGQKTPDKRLGASKVLLKLANEKQFNSVAYWDESGIEKQVKKVSQLLNLVPTTDAISLLADYIGNDSERLYRELNKLSLNGTNITAQNVRSLVTPTNYNVFQLAKKLIRGDVMRMVEIVDYLIKNGSHAKGISTILVKQFQQWLIVRTCPGQMPDDELAKLIELKNPRRLFYLKKECEDLTPQQLIATLDVLTHSQELLLTSFPEETLKAKLIQIIGILNETANN